MAGRCARQRRIRSVTGFRAASTADRRSVPIANANRLVLPDRLRHAGAMCLNFAAPHPRVRCERTGAGAARQSADRGVIYSCRVPHPWAPGEYVWRQLANDLSARIADGTYPLGSALPAEDELAREYAVVRSTVRRALGVLRKRKLIKTVPGQRNVVVAMAGPGGRPGPTASASTGSHRDLRPERTGEQAVPEPAPADPRTRRQAAAPARAFHRTGRCTWTRSRDK